MAAITNNRVTLTASICAFIICVICAGYMYSYEPLGKADGSYTSSEKSNETERIAEDVDFGGDNKFEKIILKGEKLVVMRGSQVLFSSDKDYEVADFDIGDINNDSEIELVFGFWRFGDYGKKLDFQQSRRDPKKSYHLYLYKYSQQNDNFYLVWGSSTLPHPIYDFEIVLQEGKNVLQVDEGTYEDYDNNGEITPVQRSYWIWNEWWFEEAE